MSLPEEVDEPVSFAEKSNNHAIHLVVIGVLVGAVVVLLTSFLAYCAYQRNWLRRRIKVSRVTRVHLTHVDG